MFWFGKRGGGDLKVRGIRSLICLNFWIRIGGFDGGVPTFGSVWLLRKRGKGKGVKTKL